MDVIALMTFLLKIFAILVGFSKQSGAEIPLKRQKNYQRIQSSGGMLTLTDIS